LSSGKIFEWNAELKIDDIIISIWDWHKNRFKFYHHGNILSKSVSKLKKTTILSTVVIIITLSVTAGSVFLLKGLTDKLNLGKVIKDGLVTTGIMERDNCISQFDTTDLTKVTENSSELRVLKKDGYLVVGSPGDDDNRSISKVRSGGYIISGASSKTSDGDYDFILQRYNDEGSLVWSKIIGGMSNDCAFSVTEADDGSFIVSGCSMSFTEGSFDGMVQKYDPDGNMIWSRTAGGKRNDHYYRAIESGDAILVVGDSSSFGKEDEYDILLSKYEKNGDLTWAKLLATRGNEHIFSVEEAGDGNFIGVGCSANSSYEVEVFNSVILLFDSEGNIKWSKINNSSEDGCLFALSKTADNNFIAAGHVFNRIKHDYDALVEKFDPEGNIIWGKSVGTKGESYALSVIENSEGDYIISGGMEKQKDENKGTFLSSFSQNGDYLWSKTVKTEKEAIIDSSDITDSGKIILSGYVTDSKLELPSNLYQNRDGLVIEIDKNNDSKAVKIQDDQIKLSEINLDIMDFKAELVNLYRNKLKVPENINEEVNFVTNFKKNNLKWHFDTLPKRKIWERY